MSANYTVTVYYSEFAPKKVLIQHCACLVILHLSHHPKTPSPHIPESQLPNSCLLKLSYHYSMSHTCNAVISCLTSCILQQSIYCTLNCCMSIHKERKLKRITARSMTGFGPPLVTVVVWGTLELLVVVVLASFWAIVVCASVWTAVVLASVWVVLALVWAVVVLASVWAVVSDSVLMVVVWAAVVSGSVWAVVVLASVWGAVVLASVWVVVVLASVWEAVVLTLVGVVVVLASVWAAMVLASLWAAVVIDSVWEVVALASVWVVTTLIWVVIPPGSVS